MARAITRTAFYRTVLAHVCAVARARAVLQAFTVFRALASASVGAHLSLAGDAFEAFIADTCHVDALAMAVAAILAVLDTAIAANETGIARTEAFDAVAVAIAVFGAALRIFAEVASAVGTGKALIAGANAANARAMAAAVV